MINEMMMPGPAFSAAATPVMTKMPVPMTQPMPSNIMSSMPIVLFNWPWDASGVRRAISFFRKMSYIMTTLPYPFHTFSFHCFRLTSRFIL
jgi:hypothetical protein